MPRFGKGDWGLKILALLMAVVLWVYVSNDQNPTKEQEFKAVPVEVRGVGANLAVSEIPGSINVRVQANQNVIAELNPRAIQVFVDLSSAKAGKTVVPVQVKAPTGVKIVDLRPQEVTVKLEPLAEKQVPVKIHSENETRSGFKVFAADTKPEEVILRGPKGILDRVDFATADINLKDRDRSFGGTVPVRVIDETGSYLEEGLVKRSPPSVDILVSIVPDMPTKTVQAVPQITGEPAKGYAVKMTVVEPPELVITGELNVLNGLPRVFTRPIDITGAANDVFMNIEPDLPNGVAANRQSLKVLVKIGRE